MIGTNRIKKISPSRVAMLNAKCHFNIAVRNFRKTPSAKHFVELEAYAEYYQSKYQANLEDEAKNK